MRCRWRATNNRSRSRPEPDARRVWRAPRASSGRRPLADEGGLGHLQAEPPGWDAFAGNHIGNTSAKWGSDSSAPDTLTAIVKTRASHRGSSTRRAAAASFKTNESILASAHVARQGDEISGPRRAMGWRQRTRPRRDQGLVFQGEERLIEKNSSAFSIAWFSSSGDGLPMYDAMGRVEGAVPVPTCLLGLVHHRVGIANQVKGWAPGSRVTTIPMLQ